MQPLASICIPTCKRPEIVAATVKSLLSQNVDHQLFDICITDNSETNETEMAIKPILKKYNNLKYKRTTCKGFLNSIESLKFGDGEYLKLHNDYSKWNPNTLADFLKIVKKARDSKSVIFWGLGKLSFDDIRVYDNFNDFIYDISYWSTWSSAFGIWKSKFKEILMKSPKIDYMFPHTSLLFYMHSEPQYIIDNNKYCYNMQLEKKGGYNVVNNFGNLYMQIVTDAYKNGYINSRTYQRISDDILKFIATSYWNTKRNPGIYSFTYDNYEQIIQGTFGVNGLKKYLKYLEQQKAPYVSPMINQLKNSRIAIYGAGRVGYSIYSQINKNDTLTLTGWFDKRFDVKDSYPFKIEAPDQVQVNDFDYIYIAMKNEKVANEIKMDLIKLGVDEKKILWDEVILIYK